MFIGHFGLGFGAKKAAPDASLGTLFAAAQLADLLWPVLLLAGVERVEIRPGATPVNALVFTHYPWSHSLAALLLWGAAFAIAHRVLRRPPLRTTVVLAALVASHWALDAATHVPDMPVGFSGPLVGLGLWRSRAATVAVEVPLFLAGAVVYARATRPRDRIGTIAFGGLVLFLLLFYVASLFAAPPPGVTAVALGTLAMALLVAWGAWVDRHREARD